MSRGRSVPGLDEGKGEFMRKILMIAPLLVAAASQALLADEGRIPIFRPTRITQPGHYVVTRNIAVTAGVLLDIQAGGVTVDLNGHTLSSSSLTDDLVQITCPGGVEPPDPEKLLNADLIGGLNAIHAIPPGPCKLSLEDLQIGDPSIRAIFVEETGQVEIRGIIISDFQGSSGVPAIDLRASSTRPRGSAELARLVMNGVNPWGMFSHVVAHLSDGLVNLSGIVNPNSAVLSLVDAPGSSLRDFNINWVAPPDPDAPAISLIASSGVLLDGNVVRCDGSVRTANLNHGVFVDAASHDAKIMNNTITGASGDGIHVESRGNNLIGNLASGNTGNGIFVAGDNNLVDANKVAGSLRNGLFFNTAGTPLHVFRDNVLRGNAGPGVGGPFGTAVTDAGGNVQ